MVTFRNISTTLTKRLILFDFFAKALDIFNSYEKVVLTGDFNAQENECVFDSFLFQDDKSKRALVTKSQENQAVLVCI